MSKNTQTHKGKTIADNLSEQLAASLAQVEGKSTPAPASKSKRASKLAPAPAPAPVKRTRAPKGQGYANHSFERKSEDLPCKACGEPYLHAKGFCSSCYNAARKPLKQGKTGAALIAAVRKSRGLPENAPAPKRTRASGSSSSKRREVVKAAA